MAKTDRSAARWRAHRSEVMWESRSPLSVRLFAQRTHGSRSRCLRSRLRDAVHCHV